MTLNVSWFLKVAVWATWLLVAVVSKCSVQRAGILWIWWSFQITARRMCCSDEVITCDIFRKHQGWFFINSAKCKVASKRSSLSVIKSFPIKKETGSYGKDLVWTEDDNDSVCLPVNGAVIIKSFGTLK